MSAGRKDAGGPGSQVPPSPSGTPRVADAPGGPPPVSSESLLRGATEILIRHGEEIYRLRATSKGKLLLTK